MRPFAVGQPLQARAVELHLVEVTADRVVAVRGEVDSLGDVESVDAEDLPIAVRQLLENGALFVVIEIDVAEARTLGRPQKAIAIEKDQIVGHIDPMGVCLRHDGARAASLRIHIDELKLVLAAVQKLYRQRVGVPPVDPRDVLGGAIDPCRATILDIHDADTHAWVWIARLRVTLEVDLRLARDEVWNRVGRNERFIELEKRDVPAVRRPVVAGPDVQLFGVDPVEIAVQNEIAPAKCQLLFVSAAHWNDPNVMLVDEANRRAVRGELGVDDAHFGRCYMCRFAALDVVDEDPAGARKQ